MTDFELYEYSENKLKEARKRIAELEQKLEQTEKDLADYQFNYPTIKELQKEIAELKDYRLTTLAKQQTENQKYTVNLEHKLSWYDNQLTKAKEIIKAFLDSSDLNIKHKAEEFLGEF